jgi:transaldolase
MLSEGRSINITLIFSLGRHQEVMDAYLEGLEAYAQHPGADLSKVASVASFFISRVDTEVDRRLEAIGTPEALALRGKAAVAQGKLAYRQFRETFSGPRWEALAGQGARVQRPLWASTSTKNKTYPDTLYVDELIGPDTVNTLPDATIEAFSDHGTLTRRVDADVDAADEVWQTLGEVGVDMDDVADVLEREGVASFEKSFDELLDTLRAKSAELTGRYGTCRPTSTVASRCSCCRAPSA